MTNLSRQDNIDNKLILSIIATGLLSFSGIVVETAINVGFPMLIKNFHVNISTVQWMSTGYFLIVSILLPLSNYFLKKLSLRSLFFLANSLFILGLIIDVGAPCFEILLLGRIIQGLGAGIGLPLMTTIILKKSPLNRVGMLMGVGTLVMTIAPAIGPTFGGIIVERFSWHYIFIILIPILIISSLIGTATIPKTPPCKDRNRIDFITWIIIAVFFIISIYFFSKISYFLKHPATHLSLLILLIPMFGFTVRLKKNKIYLFNSNIFMNPKFNWLLLSLLLTQSCSLGLSFILPNFIETVNHNNTLQAGLAVLPGALVGAIFAPISGLVLDKVRSVLPILFGIIFQIVATLLFFITIQHLTTPIIIWGYMLYMLGNGLTFSNILTLGLNGLEENLQNSGITVYNSIQQFAGAMGTSIVSSIIAVAQYERGMDKLTGITLGTYKSLMLIIFSLVATLCFCSKVYKFKTKD
ncbi:MFS transporter [Lactococcus lactis]|uniref:MFS transporter n=1 Tax=Lactococcus lactis TaxID=1358 RepID=UPI003877B2EF